MDGIVTRLHTHREVFGDELVVGEREDGRVGDLSCQVEILTNHDAKVGDYISLVVEFSSSRILTRHCGGLKMKEKRKGYKYIEHGIELLIDGPDETTTDTTRGIHRSVNVLLVLD